MQEEPESCTVILLESSRCLIAGALDPDTAITLVALVSEDPSNWPEAMSVWPRYRTPVVVEFPTSLEFEEVERDEALDSLLMAEAWVVIDFESKRVLISDKFQEIERNATYAMVVDEEGNQQWPLSIHLPPWWELYEGATCDTINQARQSPINKPIVNRDVLFGEPFLIDLASRILDVVNSDGWKSRDVSNEDRARYPFTIAVHRDWLMTPRGDLDGRTPRELLHGAKDWTDRVIWGQHLRLIEGGRLTAVPDNWDGFATAPMGSQEMCIYFDLCRELINAGWFWCESDAGERARVNQEAALSELVSFLKHVKTDWMTGPFEGGSPPSFIIECDRRRVPRGSGFAIDGIDGIPSKQHIIDCDCPICNMMEDGMFGIGFSSIDGHHLELDEEFAFSMHETREAWEAEQCDFREFSEEMDRKRQERNLDSPDDPFAPVWSAIQDDGPIPGDRGEFLKFAFLVSEIVSDLEQREANHNEIVTLNDAFTGYRRSNGSPESASKLKEVLEAIGNRYDGLVSKSADLQSRIDEVARCVKRGDSDLDVPF